MDTLDPKKDTPQNASTESNGMSRRGFLGKATAVGAAGVGFPFIATAQSPIRWRFQSTWPARFLFQEIAVGWTKKVDELSNGRLKIEMMPAGAVVPALQIIDATSQGVIDGGHGLPAFWFGKNTAFGLFGSGPDFGMNSSHMLSWLKYGGGAELYAEIQAATNLNLQSFLCGPIPAEPLGWFMKEIKGVEDLKGLRFRTSGLSVDLFRELGMAPVQMAPADIVPALDRKLLDAAEFAGASDDLVMGFPDVAKYYYQHSFHQAANICEVMINRRRYDSLPDDLKMVLKHASDATSADMEAIYIDRMSKDYAALQAGGKVITGRAPDSILKAQIKAWSGIIEKRSAENALFAKIVESQKAWAKRVVYWHNQNYPNSEMAYDEYFADSAKG